jgi:hypothetical protein
MTLKSIRCLLTCLLAIQAIGVSAATSFTAGQVPAELVGEFSGDQYLSSLPDDFPIRDLRLGLGLQVIGSVVQDAIQNVLLQTTSTADNARLALKEHLTATGWILISETPGGSNFCHDTHGRLELRAADFPNAASRIYAKLDRNTAGKRFAATCLQLQEYLNAPLVNFQDLYYLLPGFDIPDNTVLPPGYGLIDLVYYSSLFYGTAQLHTSPSSFGISREGTLEITDYSAALLYTFLSAQMTAQGWSEDSGASGPWSASAVWHKTTDTPAGVLTGSGDIGLTAILTLLNTHDDVYRVLLSLRADAVITGPIIGSPLVIGNYGGDGNISIPCQRTGDSPYRPATVLGITALPVRCILPTFMP